MLQKKSRLSPLVFPIFLAVSCLFLPLGFAEEGGLNSAFDEPEYLVLKMMIVNPSEKHEQVFPMKAYLPDEVEPEHVIDLGGLELSFDPDKEAHYVHKDLVLQPGEQVIQSIKIKDVWFIADSDMDQLAEEARDLYEKLLETKYKKQARLLLTNVETLLLQIKESQRDETLTPDEHIALYKSNRRKMTDVEMDVMAMRRFVVSTGAQDTSLNLLPFGMGKSGEDSGGEDLFESRNTGGSGGQLQAQVVWKIIIVIVGFTGMLSLMFFGFWQHQVRVTESKRKVLASGKRRSDKEIRLGDFLGPDVESEKAEKKAKKAA